MTKKGYYELINMKNIITNDKLFELNKIAKFRNNFAEDFYLQFHGIFLTFCKKITYLIIYFIFVNLLVTL